MMVPGHGYPSEVTRDSYPCCPDPMSDRRSRSKYGCGGRSDYEYADRAGEGVRR